MGNLVRNTTRLLINNDANQFTADTENNKLFVKDYAGSIEADKATYSGQAKKVLKVGKKNPVPSVAIMEVKPSVSTQPETFTTGINVRKQAKFKGFVDEIPEVAKYYDGIVEYCAPLNGSTLADEDIVTLRKSLMDIINGDSEGFAFAGVPLILDVADQEATTTAKISIDGTEKEYTGGTVQKFAEAVNADGLAHVVVDTESDMIYIVGVKGQDITEAATPGYENLSTNNSFTRPLFVISRDDTRKLMITPGNVGPTIYVQAGNYGYLTSLDMYRLFSIKPHDFYSRPNIPMEDTDYVKYRFELLHDGYSLDGFGHEDKVREKLEIYLADIGNQVADFEAKLDSIGLSPIGDSFV